MPKQVTVTKAANGYVISDAIGAPILIAISRYYLGELIEQALTDPPPVQVAQGLEHASILTEAAHNLKQPVSAGSREYVPVDVPVDDASLEQRSDEQY